MYPPILTTGRLILRPFNSADLAALVREILGNPRVVATLPINPGDLREQQSCAQHYMKVFSDSWRTIGYGGWAVCAREGDLASPGTLLGFAGFLSGRLQQQGAELGYGIGESYWGQGVGFEAARACVRWFFANCKEDRCYASSHPGNQAARTILESIGFRYQRDQNSADSVGREAGRLQVFALSLDDYLNA